ncbi:MAG: NAD-dependent epimerase/dehydratase family protein [Planctomycetota bacterium]|nr:MAG: NAD-dependent epimerase/dehydratase family protein [Planctomycetota bacterium]
MLTLVTGATGLVGNNVVRRLLDQGQAVRVLVRASAAERPLEGLAVERVFGDICDPASVCAAMADVERVVHSAGDVRIGWTGLERMRRVNVDGTRHVARAAREAGARLVHVSTADAAGIGSYDMPADEETSRRGDVLTPYVVTKREAEQAIHEEIDRGLWAAIVNPAFMLGPWDWKPSSGQMLVEVGRGRGTFAPRGDFSVVDVRDVAAAILAAFDRGESGRRYLLSGENMSYLDAWRQFAEVAGARRPLTAIGPVISWLAGRGGDLAARITGSESNVNSGALAMAALPKIYSCARAEQELGFRRRPLDETIRDAWNWFREYGYVKGAASGN